MKLIYDKNGFVKLFAKSRNSWIEDQEDRFCKMAKVIKIFENFYICSKPYISTETEYF